MQSQTGKNRAMLNSGTDVRYEYVSKCQPHLFSRKFAVFHVIWNVKRHTLVRVLRVRHGYTQCKIKSWSNIRPRQSHLEFNSLQFCDSKLSFLAKFQDAVAHTHYAKMLVRRTWIRRHSSPGSVSCGDERARKLSMVAWSQTIATDDYEENCPKILHRLFFPPSFFGGRGSHYLKSGFCLLLYCCW